MSVPWLLRMRWVDLLFAHWPLDPGQLGGLLPAGLEPELHDGRAWLGIVPFTMADVAPRGVPAIPRLSRFPELNVRTYVRHRGVPGVWFLSLDAASRPTVEGARRAFHLPYFRAEMTAVREADVVTYASIRADGRGSPAAFAARYGPTGPPALATPGSLEAFLTDRPRLFAVDGRGRISQTSVEHAPWPLRPAWAEITTNTMASSHGIDLPDVPPHLLFADRVDVHGHLPTAPD